MQDLFTTASPRGGIESPPPRASRPAGIPVPPYDKPLPPEYWNSLPRRKPKDYRPHWIAGFCVLGVCAFTLGAVLGSREKEVQPFSPSDIRVAPTPWPDPDLSHYRAPDLTPPPQALVPRAELNLPPGSNTEHIVWKPGYRYLVTMPDGRQLACLFKGWVAHASELPRQPAGGANNALYLETTTGHGWVWTIPASGSNVPRWIDP